MRPRHLSRLRVRAVAGALVAAGLAGHPLGAAAPAQAEAITPSHVYQVVESMQAELALLLDANFSATEIPAEQSVPGRRPRHVIQEARHVFEQVQMLKRINGLPTVEAEPAPVREITPADVKASVDLALAEIRTLRAPFALDSEAEAAVLRDGMTPTDVHAALGVVATLVQRLDLPAIVPNDVYRVALAIKADTAQIHAKLGAPAPQPIPRGIEGRKPPQVYARAFDLLERLEGLAGAGASLEIPGGVVLPPRKTEKLMPSDVLGVLNTILAELSSVKVAAGAGEPTPLLPPQVGRTPNDVYIVVEETMAILDAIAAATS